MPPTASTIQRQLPPRHWWLRRCGIVALAAVVGIAVLRVTWGLRAQREFDRTVADLRAKGRPALPVDLTPTDLPDEQNAATYYVRAAAALNRDVDSPSTSSITFRPIPPYPQLWWEMSAKSFNAQQNALQIARHARAHPRAVWRKSYPSPLINLSWPALSQQRSLGNTLVDAALYQHMLGNDAGALELALDSLHHADAIEQEPLMAAHMTAVSVHGSAMTAIATIAPGIGLSEEQRNAPLPITPAPPDCIKSLIARLLDDDRQNRRCTAMLYYERVLLMDTITHAAMRARLLGPAFKFDAADCVSVYDTAAMALEDATWGKAAQRLSSGGANQTASERLSRVMRFALVPPVSRVVQTEFRLTLLRRMTAVSLAANWYRRDTGNWPENLDALVPAYLPAVPVDPYDPAHAALGYRIVDGNRPIVFSVGENAALDAEPTAFWPQPVYSWENSSDQFIDLSRFIAPPATQAAPSEGPVYR